MIGVALKSILAHKMRTALTSLAIVLGVAMVSGSYILTDTWRAAADDLSAAAYDNVDAVVTTKTAFKTDNTQAGGQHPTLPAAVLDRIRATQQVAVAAGDISDQVRLVGPAGRPIGGDGSPVFGAGIDARTPGATALSPFKLRSGRYPRGNGEVTLDAATAKDEHLALGDRVGVSAAGPSQPFTIVGTATFGSVQSLGGASAAILDLRQAQALFDKRGRYDSILVSARNGVAPAELRSAIARTLPPGLQVQSAQQQDRFGVGDIKNGLGIFQKILVGFGFIALFVGGFVIFNTLAITVAQRSREFALLRTIGASRRQVLGSVVLEAAVTGVVASVIGIATGWVLSGGLNAAFKALGMDLPASDTVLAGRTVLVGLLFGVGMTTLAGLIPAIRATRVDPVAALREGAVPAGRHSRVAPVLGAVLSAAAVAAMVYGMFAGGVSVGGRLAAIGFGCLALFLGVAMLSSRLVPPLASLLGRPAERIAGSPGRLARENAMRNPHRTAVTAAALMIGIALVTLVATFGQGLKSSWKESYAKQLQTDYVVTAGDGTAPVAGGAAKALAATPGVRTVTAIREDQARAYGEQMQVDGVEPATIGQIYRYHWKRGSEGALARLGSDGTIVTDRFAKKHHLAVGDRFPITSPGGTRVSLTVRGIDKRPAFNPLNIGNVSISHELFARMFQTRDDLLVLFNVDRGAGAATRGQLQHTLAQFPGSKLKTSTEYQKLGDTWINNMLGLLYGLLGLSVIVSLFGIVNTLALAVFERTRELGTLRAVGMTRRQVRRMMRHEGIIVAMIGAVLGMTLGLLLGALVARALAGEGLKFAVPVGSLVAFLLVAVVAGTLAAILPARRASRLNVLHALQYE